MAYNALNNLIDAYIYANGVQAITGQILNGVLKQMVSQLGSGYHLMGVAGPETVPASNDYAMAYFAATAGEYTDFGGITLAAGEVAVLLTSGNGSWSKQTIYNVPTTTEDLENTANFITNAVTDLVNYYTKTEVDDTLANYPTLEALATALADYYTKTEIDTILAGYTTNTALASALADYYNKNDIDGLLSVVNASLADRYTKSETDTKLADYYRKAETYDKDEVDSIVAALSRQEYIVAWDGLAAPDVSAIPAGVTVTYSGTPYTGTLAASAFTVNKIYMVWNGVAYDMYGTSQDGGYSWVPMGTTTVDLSQYATKAELSQLEAKVDGIVPFPYTVTKGREYDAGGYTSWNRYSCTDILSAGTFNFKCPDGFWYTLSKYVSDSEGVLIYGYNSISRENVAIDTGWIMSVKKIDGTELTTSDIDTINGYGMISEITGNSIDKMRDDISDLQDDVFAVEGDISDLQDDIDEINGKIDTIEDELNGYYNPETQAYEFTDGVPNYQTFANTLLEGKPYVAVADVVSANWCRFGFSKTNSVQDVSDTNNVLLIMTVNADATTEFVAPSRETYPYVFAGVPVSTNSITVKSKETKDDGIIIKVNELE